MKMMQLGIVAILGLLVAACSGGARYQIPTQQWGDMVIEVQVRPEPPQAGMTEFLVVATEKRGRPVHDLIVTLRTKPTDPWQQAIQDGHSGVYRRALNLAAGKRSVAVHLTRKSNSQETELQFPLEVMQ